MSSTNDKATGTINEVAGNIKLGIGAATDNERLETEGAAQETKGEAQQTLGHAKDAVGNALHNVGKAIKGS